MFDPQLTADQRIVDPEIIDGPDSIEFRYRANIQTNGNHTFSYKITFQMLAPDGHPRSDHVSGALILRIASKADVVNFVETSPITIWPNPASSKFRVSSSDESQTYIFISDMLGDIMHTSSFVGSSTINTESWPRGVYSVAMRNRTLTTYSKLIIE